MNIIKRIVIGVTIIVLLAVIGYVLLYYSQKNNLSDNSIQTEGEKYLSFPNGSLSKIYLVNSRAEYGNYDHDIRSPPLTIKQGEPCVVVTGTIRSDYDRDYWMGLKVQLYNVSGYKVGTVTDLTVPFKDVIIVNTKSNVTRSFEIYVKYDNKDVSRYDIYLGNNQPMTKPHP